MFKWRTHAEFDQTDSSQTVHVSVFFKWMDRSEHALYKKLDPSFFDNHRLPHRAMNCEFISPIEFDDMVTVELKLENIGNSSITYSFLFRNDTKEKVSAEGSMTVVCVDDDFKPTSIPLDFKEKLKEYLS